MKKPLFDHYAQEYNTLLSKQLTFFDAEHDYFAEYKVILTKNILSATPKSILDYGCGIGRSTLFLTKHFPTATIYGCDPSAESLTEAKTNIPNALFLGPEALMASLVQFDVIFVACVLHHVPPAERPVFMNKLVQLSKPGTTLVIFEHNPFNPVTRHLVNTCPFDKEAILLKPKELKTLFANAGLQNIHCQYTLFFPHSLQFLRPLERYLQYLPLGGQYLVSGHYVV